MFNAPGYTRKVSSSYSTMMFSPPDSKRMFRPPGSEAITIHNLDVENDGSWKMSYHFADALCKHICIENIQISFTGSEEATAVKILGVENGDGWKKIYHYVDCLCIGQDKHWLGLLGMSGTSWPGWDFLA